MEAFIFTKMGSKPFQFKQFNVAQNRCTHKVGTDGVLLGAWVNIQESDRTMLDVGTGSGLIALMLAQRSCAETRIDALDIAAPEVEQAKENVQRSPWPEKIHVYQKPVQKFACERKYDLIVSNPPYFVNCLLPPEKKRSVARHTRELSFEDLLQNASRLLSPAGRLAVILPYDEGVKFIDLGQEYQLFLVRQTAFRAREHKPYERLLLELAHESKSPVENEITLFAAGETWSESYKTLIRDFYLKG